MKILILIITLLTTSCVFQPDDIIADIVEVEQQKIYINGSTNYIEGDTYWLTKIMNVGINTKYDIVITFLIYMPDWREPYTRITTVDKLDPMQCVTNYNIFESLTRPIGDIGISDIECRNKR